MTAKGHGKWLPPFSVNGEDVQLFCFPYAGGGASIYRDWPTHARSFQPVAVRLPGREIRILERPIDRLPEMVETLADVLRPYTAARYAFFGHSMGALIAYELTLRFLDDDVPPPTLLAVSGRQAPHLLNSTEWESTRGVSDARFVEILSGINSQTAQMLSNPALYNLMLPSLRADFRLCEDYCPRQPSQLPVPILAFSGTMDPSVSTDDIREWNRHTNRSFGLEICKGDHFFVNSHAASICSAIGRRLLANRDAESTAASA